MHIKTPDIGVDKATVAEILVKVGDRIAVEDSVVLLESAPDADPAAPAMSIKVAMTPPCTMEPTVMLDAS